MKSTQTNAPAKVAYKKAQQEVLNSIRVLEGRIRERQRNLTIARREINWAHVGDLKHLDELLAEALAFFTKEA